jgi:hypothetical protein
MADKASYCSLCVQIAALRAFGYTNAEAASRISTPDHPSGIAEKTLYNHSRDHRSEIEQLTTWITLAKREKQLDVKELTTDTLREEMKAALGTSWASIQAAIRDGNTELAVWHLEQVIGKAKNNLDVNHRGAVGHFLMKQADDETARQSVEIERSIEMRRQILAPADAMEAEVIETVATAN